MTPIEKARKFANTGTAWTACRRGKSVFRSVAAVGVLALALTVGACSTPGMGRNGAAGALGGAAIGGAVTHSWGGAGVGAGVGLLGGFGLYELQQNAENADPIPEAQRIPLEVAQLLNHVSTHSAFLKDQPGAWVGDRKDPHAAYAYVAAISLPYHESFTGYLKKADDTPCYGVRALMRDGSHLEATYKLQHSHGYPYWAIVDAATQCGPFPYATLDQVRPSDVPVVAPATAAPSVTQPPKTVKVPRPRLKLFSPLPS